MVSNTFSPASGSFSQTKVGLPVGSKIVVIGAGAFGGWSSLYLLRKGYHVTLVDAWGAGNSRSSSGDETRVIRSTYGENEFYFTLNVRALELWKENQERWNKKLFINTGVLWFCYQEKNPLIDDSLPFAKKNVAEYEYLSVPQVNQRFPSVNTNDLHHVWFDPHGGYLKARESCQVVKDAFVNEGGNWVQSQAQPGKISYPNMEYLLLSNGEKLKADAFLFACGSWLPQLFPDLLADRITPTKQEVYYFGVPKASAAAYDSMPVWIDLDGRNYYYGIAGNASRGFKVGVDLRGEVFDPTLGDRTINPYTLLKTRQFLAHRFPGLKDAPLVENRVCPYENSSDGNFIFERHPSAANIWFLGGGSGHGFKHGPALGEHVAHTFM